MRRLWGVLLYYGLIPLVASFVGGLPLLFGAPPWICLILVPALTGLLYFGLGERLDRRWAQR